MKAANINKLFLEINGRKNKKMMDVKYFHISKCKTLIIFEYSYEHRRPLIAHTYLSNDLLRNQLCRFSHLLLSSIKHMKKSQLLICIKSCLSLNRFFKKYYLISFILTSLLEYPCYFPLVPHATHLFGIILEFPVITEMVSC